MERRVFGAQKQWLFGKMLWNCCTYPSSLLFTCTMWEKRGSQNNFLKQKVFLVHSCWGHLKLRFHVFLGGEENLIKKKKVAHSGTILTGTFRDVEYGMWKYSLFILRGEFEWRKAQLDSRVFSLLLTFLRHPVSLDSGWKKVDIVALHFELLINKYAYVVKFHCSLFTSSGKARKC